MSAISPGRAKTAPGSSARKLLATLLTFTADRPTPTIAELARQVAVPASTMYRYVAVLRETGLVEALGDGRYRLTDAMVGLNAAADAGRTSLIDAARPHLMALREEIDETVLLARRGGDHAYCIARENSSHPVRLQFAIGQAMPLHSGSVARVLLAAMPLGDRTSLLNEHLAAGPPVNAALLSDEALAKIALDGWTESYEEIDPGVWGCAAAITHGEGGHVVAALGTAGPIARLDAARRSKAIAHVRSTARLISQELSS